MVTVGNADPQPAIEQSTGKSGNVFITASQYSLIGGSICGREGLYENFEALCTDTHMKDTLFFSYIAAMSSKRVESLQGSMDDTNADSLNDSKEYNQVHWTTSGTLHCCDHAASRSLRLIWQCKQAQVLCRSPTHSRRA